MTVDAAIDEFDHDLIDSMIRQSGLAKDDFYGTTKATAKKLNLPWRRKTEPKDALRRQQE